MTAVRVLERVACNTALGLRFWDPAQASSAVDGLRVEVFPRGNPHARRVAQVNRTGVYVVHGLPGMREFEHSTAEPELLWAAATRPYRVEVRDPAGRFLPIDFDADLPVRGPFTWLAPWLSPPRPVVLPGDGSSPPQLLLERIPLFSAPSRPVPDPLAVVYAQLLDSGTGRPAAWALLAVAIDGVSRGVGLADDRGRVAVLFPYPEPPRRSLTSPPEARNDFSWQVALQAFGSPGSPPADVPTSADLADVLAATDSPRDVLESTTSPATPLRLGYREPLTVRTAGGSGANASFLFIS